MIADDVARRPFELAAVDQQDELFGTLDETALGGDQHDVRLHQALRPHRRGAHEQFGRVKAWHQIVARRRQNDVLLTKDGAAGNGDAGRCVGQQRADDVQRVGQHLQRQPVEVRTHLQRGRTAVDDHALAWAA